MTRDQVHGVQTYFTYTLQQGSYGSQPVIANASALGAYQLLPSSNITWGGADQAYPYCNCKMQYVRFYVNYAPNTQDQMINLAVMDPTSNPYSLLFHFTIS